MSPVIHRPAPSDRAFVVPGPRTTDAVGEALCGAYGGVELLPADMLALLTELDSCGRA